MFRISKPPIELDGSLVLKAVTWQVSDVTDFNNLLVDNQYDTVNKDSLLVDLPLGDNDKYYVRTKIHYEDSGVAKETNYSKPIMVTKRIEGFAVNDVIINTPKMSVDFDPNNAPLGDFKITISDFRVFKGVGKLKHIEWVIEDESGKVRWEKKRAGKSDNSIRVPSCTLEKGKKYIIKARYYSTTNSYSNYGRLVITTDKNLIHSDCGTGLTEEDCLTKIVSTMIYTTL